MEVEAVAHSPMGHGFRVPDIPCSISSYLDKVKIIGTRSVEIIGTCF